jgi:hypothetical protein
VASDNPPVTRNAKIALMTERGQEWRKTHSAKTPRIRIQNNHVAHHLLLRLRIGDAAELKEVFCNKDGWEFIGALDLGNDLLPTVAMLLAVLDKMSETPKAR